ncbi:hypothetical protein FHX44_117115 [Pseudonocardia hierapolitana]|uniref:Uncharacterized protein n=1 Tax=Pseudonocardia hierapolitana TaxID=1128676 RepID=A0A561T243_9PSEU|nr:hypothetical protein [Pseudonocardia hierapolitana]TWF81172.1 hypothetical protein FHX44_117115 [Pseudonocardia hierapolitana]
MRAALDVATLVPGHGFLGPAEPRTSGFAAYLEHLAESVTSALCAGTPVDELCATIPARGIEPPPGAPAQFLDLVQSLHHLNVLLTYRWVQATSG